jgi:hypothetical protein
MGLNHMAYPWPEQSPVPTAAAAGGSAVAVHAGSDGGPPANGDDPVAQRNRRARASGNVEKRQRATPRKDAQ